ncbi:MAG: cysteine desulfurase [Thermoplasmatota archaeon]
MVHGHPQPAREGVAGVRAEDFPALHQDVHGHHLVYLDNAATTQKPRAVLDAERSYYEKDNANVHRGVHLLSERATRSFEGARRGVAHFVGATAPEVVFTRGTTEAINLVAQAFVRPRLAAGDEILVTELEHHSNIVPWQMICREKGATLRFVPITDAGELDHGAMAALLASPRLKFFSFAHVSNALGTVNPVQEMVEAAHARGVPVLVDGAQAVAHRPVDVSRLGCEFYAASGHKMYGPTGIGFLVGRRDVLEGMPPWQGGGDMIRSVSLHSGTTYNEVPYRFEAGTPNIAGAVGLGAAVTYLKDVGLETAGRHEDELLRYATERLKAIPGLTVVGTAHDKAAVLSFTLAGIHPHDVGSLLDRDGIAIRTGHHCAMPVMERFGLPATARASFALYNTKAEIDLLASSLEKVVQLFAR